VRLNFREFFASLPITGRFIESELIPIATVRAWLVRHPTLGLYWRDPYALRSKAGDPRSDWGTQAQAWRFHTAEQAEYLMAEHAVRGTLISIVISYGNTE